MARLFRDYDSNPDEYLDEEETRLRYVDTRC